MDIVKRLRAWQGGKWPKDHSIDDDMREAADEIERLRHDVSRGMKNHNADLNAVTEVAAPEWDRVERRKDNWTLITAKERKRIGRRFKGYKGQEFIFFGIVDGYDDYYYGMGSWEKGKEGIHLLSCVGSIEMMGFTEIPSKSLEDEERDRYEAAMKRREFAAGGEQK